VNPFLTIMNFKISYKTWLKLARTNIHKLSKKKDTDNFQTFNEQNSYAVQDEDKPSCKVEIEVEITFSTTSEEDSKEPIMI